jgi:hypothetical protein
MLQAEGIPIHAFTDVQRKELVQGEGSSRTISCHPLVRPSSSPSSASAAPAPGSRNIWHHAGWSKQRTSSWPHKLLQIARSCVIGKTKACP